MILRVHHTPEVSLPAVLITPNHIILSLYSLGIKEIIAGRVTPYTGSFSMSSIYDDTFRYVETKSEIPCLVGLGCIFTKDKQLKLIQYGNNIYVDKSIVLEATPLDKYIHRNIVKPTLKNLVSSDVHFIDFLAKRTEVTLYEPGYYTYDTRIDLEMRLNSNGFRNKILQLFGE